MSGARLSTGRGPDIGAGAGPGDDSPGDPVPEDAPAGGKVEARGGNIGATAVATS